MVSTVKIWFDQEGYFLEVLFFGETWLHTRN